MKRIILTAIIFLIIGGAAGYFLNPVINKKSAPTDIPASMPEPGKQPESGFIPPEKKEGNDDERQDKELRENESIGRIDYPLIDIYFEEEKTYKITVQEYGKGMAAKGEEESKKYREYEDKGKFFQFNKESFSIITGPSGRGTTPSYILKVYEGKKCIKTIDCFRIREGILDNKW